MVKCFLQNVIKCTSYYGHKNTTFHFSDNANLYYSSKMLYHSSFEVQKGNWELARTYFISTIARARRDFYCDCIIASTSIDPFLLQKYWFVYISMILSFSLSFAYFLCFWLFVCFPHFSMHVIYEPLFHLFYASLIAIIRFTVFPMP